MNLSLETLAIFLRVLGASAPALPGDVLQVRPGGGARRMLSVLHAIGVGCIPWGAGGGLVAGGGVRERRGG